MTQSILAGLFNSGAYQMTPNTIGPVVLRQPYYTNETNIDAVRCSALHGIGSPLSQAKAIAGMRGVPFGRIVRNCARGGVHQVRLEIARTLASRGFKVSTISKVLQRDGSSVRAYLRA